MSGEWICPVCGSLNDADQIVCCRTPEHDADDAHGRAEPRPRRRTQFPPAALEYRRRLVEQAPPLSPEQQAIIRAACTPPKPGPSPKKKRQAA